LDKPSYIGDLRSPGLLNHPMHHKREILPQKNIGWIIADHHFNHFYCQKSYTSIILNHPSQKNFTTEKSHLASPLSIYLSWPRWYHDPDLRYSPCGFFFALVVLFQHHQDHPRSSSTFDPPFDIAPFVIGVKGLGFPEE
jgi:hypothetical protein